MYLRLSYHKFLELQTWELTSPQPQLQASSHFTDRQSRRNDLANVARDSSAIGRGWYPASSSRSVSPPPGPVPSSSQHPWETTRDHILVQRDLAASLAVRYASPAPTPYPPRAPRVIHSSWKSMVALSTIPLRISCCMIRQL